MPYMTEIELQCAVDYDYQPYEPMERNYPGCDAAVYVRSVMLGTLEVIGFLSPQQISDLEQEILEHENSMAEADYYERGDYLYEQMKERMA